MSLANTTGSGAAPWLSSLGMPSWAPNQISTTPGAFNNLTGQYGPNTYAGQLPAGATFGTVSPDSPVQVPAPQGYTGGSGQVNAAYSLSEQLPNKQGSQTVWYDASGQPINVQGLGNSGPNWMDSVVQAATIAGLAYAGGAGVGSLFGGAAGAGAGAADAGASAWGPSSALTPDLAGGSWGGAPMAGADFAGPASAGSLPLYDPAGAVLVDGGVPGVSAPIYDATGAGVAGTSATAATGGASPSLFAKAAWLAGGGPLGNMAKTTLGMWNSGGVGGSLSTLSSLASIGSGIYGLGTAANNRTAVNNLISQSNPMGPYGADYAAQLAALEKDPSLAMKAPGYMAGINAIERSGAAAGYTGSGNMNQGLAAYGGQQYAQQIQQLSGLAGQSAGQAANAASLQIGGNQQYFGQAGMSLGAIGMGLNSLWGG